MQDTQYLNDRYILQCSAMTHVSSEGCSAQSTGRGMCDALDAGTYLCPEVIVLFHSPPLP